ncbi:hypothetical protein ACFVXC_05555 [Streptomyces sp. NPDC058257]|uniref:hypothetical protein n=1 Tax=Streptomyces sp. NPDC058257 TaxID=3346409 RepID=UPI0036E5A6B8
MARTNLKRAAATNALRIHDRIHGGPMRRPFRRTVMGLWLETRGERKPRRSPARGRVERQMCRYRAFEPDNRHSVRYLWEPWYVR